VPLKIRHYLDCFKRIDTFQNACAWRSAANNRECNQEATDFLKRTGASHGVVGSINSLGGKKSDSATLIQLQYTDEQFASAHLWFVNIIVFYLHIYFVHCAASLHHPHARNNLTFREKEVLQWVVQGKTSWEVGRILSMSERTVKFHLQNIYTKLNVVNRAQAVSMASRLQLI
jgi:LuxR family quorum-sensing system transcriptional regulator SolR